MRKFLVIATLLLMTIGSTFAMSIEAYGLYGLDYTPIGHSDIKFKGQSWGGGVSFSNVDPKEFFGVFASINILYTTKLDVVGSRNTTPFEIDKHLAADLLLGIRMNPKVLFISFPIDIGIHTATDWLYGHARLRLGIGANLGVKINLGKFGIFARAQLAYDLVEWRFENSGTNFGKSKVFSVMPQVGLSFSF